MPQRFHGLMGLVVGGLIAVCASGAWASIVIDTVTVGNAGNAADTRYNSMSVGAVGYTYQMGKYDVTTSQYAAFLNAVARTDAYGLYNTYMDQAVHILGCNIKRSGSSGSYTYSVGTGSQADITNWGNRPVSFLRWGDSARLANWMYNGQPTGAQGPGTTETGSYALNGATTDAALMAVTRRPNATWVIPSENEWYKAAYNKNDGVTGNYWDYPTRTSAVPNNGNPEGDTGNSANFYDGAFTIGSPYYRTNVGFFSLSGSPYGTFDQGGNVWEWNEAIISGSSRGLRGGSFDLYAYARNLLASTRSNANPAYEGGPVGFRLVGVPEPATLALLAFGGVAALMKPKRLRR